MFDTSVFILLHLLFYLSFRSTIVLQYMLQTIMKHSCRYFLVALVACHMSMVAVNLMSMFLESPFPSTSAKCSENSVYIPGAGFSGFFYTLGRLSSLGNETSTTGIESPYEYYCFSSGCLALVTHLLGRNVDSALKLAHESRNQFITGNIGPYSIVGEFVDGLLFGDAETDASVHLHYEGNDQCSTNQNASNAKNRIHDHLSRINIITTSWNKANIPSQSIRRPSSVDELRQMLIQTTWM